MLNLFSEFMLYLKFTDGIAVSDVLGWIFAAICGAIAYHLIDHMQMSLERHNMLHMIEQDISNLYNSTIALSGTIRKIDILDVADEEKLIIDLKQDVMCWGRQSTSNQVMLRSILHNFSDWKHDKSENIEIIDSQRYVLIRDGWGEDNVYYYEWVSTQALHEIVLLCCRIEKMYKSRIIKRLDLTDLQHELLALGRGGRIQFMAEYYDKYEAECISYLVMQVVVSCEKCKNEEAITGFIQDYIKDYEELKQYFEENRRIRKIKDIYTLYKFKKIILKHKN